MTEPSTRRIYDVQSFFYDLTFARLVRKRVERAVTHMRIGPTDRVLDLGIGTGAALSFYPRHSRVIGVDLSRGMLRECRKKMQQCGLTHATVFQANALELPFADDSFDHVFISHVISVVSDPCKLIMEAQRVLKPGARIVIVNHFQSTNRFVALLEQFLCPLCTKLGWRSDLALADLIRRTGVEIDYRFKVDNIDLWETVVISNDKASLRKQPQGAEAELCEVAA
ncbi:MAG: methyltransferase domain-containing protein [Tepidisphaeraceae bacterium]